MHVVIDRTL